MKKSLGEVGFLDAVEPGRDVVELARRRGTP
jgi:hypothetical protein